MISVERQLGKPSLGRLFEISNERMSVVRREPKRSLWWVWMALAAVMAVVWGMG